MEGMLTSYMILLLMAAAMFHGGLCDSEKASKEIPGKTAEGSYIIDETKKATEKATTKVLDAIDHISEGVKEALDEAKKATEKVKGALDEAKKTTDGAKETLVEATKAASEDAKETLDKVKTAADSAKETLDEASKAASDAAKEALDKAKRAASDATSGVSQAEGDEKKSSKESVAVDEKMLEYAQGSVCGYCSYCKFCPLCDKECPCETSSTKPNCHMCKYCSYCSLCSPLCDTVCVSGGIVDIASGAIVNSLPSFNKEEVDEDIESVSKWVEKDEL